MGKGKEGGRRKGEGKEEGEVRGRREGKGAPLSEILNTPLDVAEDWVYHEIFFVNFWVIILCPVFVH